MNKNIVFKHQLFNYSITQLFSSFPPSGVRGLVFLLVLSTVFPDFDTFYKIFCNTLIINSHYF